MSEKTVKKPRVKITGEDGNAFAILARCHRAAKDAGWTDEQWEAFSKEAKSGNYEHLLGTVCDHFKVR